MVTAPRVVVVLVSTVRDIRPISTAVIPWSLTFWILVSKLCQKAGLAFLVSLG